MKIGLVPMAAKPYHAGHHGLVMLASKENDHVILFVSTADRKRHGELPILGKTMLQIWTQFLEPILPSNVEVRYVPVPVTGVYNVLETAEQENSEDDFSIYSDAEDITKYREQSLKKSAKEIYNDERIHLRGVERSSTVDISGTEMRQLLTSKAAKDKKKFISFLPSQVQMHGAEIYSLLSKEMNESLIREYITTLLVG
jgi:nicotinamide mononucleotide adenylyltransferase